MKNPSATVALPDPTYLLFLMVTVLALVLGSSDLGWAGALLAGVLWAPVAVLAFYLLATRPEAGIILLVVAAAMPRYFVEISGLRARPEHIAAGLLCLAVPFLLRRRAQPLRWIFPDYLLVAYIGLNIFSSLFGSVAPAQTIRWAMQQLLAILPYFFLRVLVTDESLLRKAVAAVLVLGALQGAYAVLCFYSYTLFRTEFGVTPDQYGNIPGIYGAQFEANIMGAYCGACAILMLAMYLQARRRRYLLGYAMALAGATISLSRAAIGATLLASLVVVLVGWRRHLLNRFFLLKVAAATFCVLLVLLPALSLYAQRFSSVRVSDPSADDNLVTRLIQLALALDAVTERPLLGHGTASFQLGFDSTGDDDSQDSIKWIANTEVRVLHDVGLVGLAVFLAFLGSLAARGRRLVRRLPQPQLLALLLAAIVYCISFQFTEGTLLAFSWIHLGLIACAVSLPSLSSDGLPGQ